MWLSEAGEDIVQVTGEVVEDEEINIITVGSFKVFAASAADEVEEGLGEEAALEDTQLDEVEDSETEPEG